MINSENPITKDLNSDTLEDIVRSAWDVGKEIDLSGIGYGRIHWGNREDVKDQPSSYYYFLAGLVRKFSLARILEIGTHWGGATRAMWYGLNDPDSAKIVTVDITTESDNRLLDYPKIQKIVGDANSEAIFDRIATSFDWEPIDLIYIDAAHQTVPTVMSFALYAMALRPKLMVLDDITLNEPMKAAWSKIKTMLPAGSAVNAAEIEKKIRDAGNNPGFGLIRLMDNT